MKKFAAAAFALIIAVSFSTIIFTEDAYAATKKAKTTVTETKTVTANTTTSKSNTSEKSLSTTSNASSKSDVTNKSNVTSKSYMSTNSNASTESDVSTESDAASKSNSNTDSKASNKSKTNDSRISIKNFTIILDNYIAYYDGTEKTPDIKKVYYEKSDSSVPAKKRIVHERNYSVRYYTMVMTSEGTFSPGKEVDSIIDKGEYYVAVTGIGEYKGTAYQAFSVLGKRQNITIDQTSYKRIAGDDVITLNPAADGDATGFRFSSSNKLIASVSSAGEIKPLAPGLAEITISTKGSTEYDEAEIVVKIKVLPKKMSVPTLTVKNSKKVDISWNVADGVTKYEIQYGTNSKFKSGTYKSKKLTTNYLLKKFGDEAETYASVLPDLTTGKKYYVRIRSIKEYTDANGITARLYGEWSDIESVVPKKVSKAKSDSSKNTVTSGDAAYNTEAANTPSVTDSNVSITASQDSSESKTK